MVTVTDVPQGSVLVGAFDTTEGAIGQITVVPVLAGEQVVASKVTGSGTALSEFGDNPPVALLLQEGMRAVSVEVASVVSAGGLIRPGDYVDVILTVRTQGATDATGQSSGSNQIAATILQNVQVLAIDQTVKSVAVSPDEVTETKEGDPEATTVTLAVRPVQGEVLTLADACRLNFSGRLGLALRGLGDQTTLGNRSEWPADGAAPDCASIMGLASLP
jgi:pilus assembly protein CpaB